jgi:hypothetical protein
VEHSVPRRSSHFSIASAAFSVARVDRDNGLVRHVQRSSERRRVSDTPLMLTKQTCSTRPYALSPPVRRGNGPRYQRFSRSV